MDGDCEWFHCVRFGLVVFNRFVLPSCYQGCGKINKSPLFAAARGSPEYHTRDGKFLFRGNDRMLRARP